MLTFFVIYLNAFLYAVSYQLQSPLLPFLVQSLTTDSASAALNFARLQSVFNLAQLIGVLIAGPLLDIFGAKVLLIISNLVSALCYGLTASANTTIQLILSRLPTLLQHGILATRGMVTELSSQSDAERASQLGYIMVFYGIGMVVGPAVGGKLGTTIGLRNAAWISTFIAIISVVICAVGLPWKKSSQAYARVEEESPDGKEPAEERAEESGIVRRFVIIFKMKTIQVIIFRNFFASLASRIMQSIIPIIIATDFKGTAEDLGYLMSYIGVLVALVQGCVVKPVTTRYPTPLVIFYSACSLCAGAFLFGFCSKLYQIYLVLAPLMIGGSLYGTVSTAQISNSVEPKYTGTVLAIDMASTSAVGIFAPDLGLAIYNRFGIFGIGSSTALLCTVSALVAFVSLGAVQIPKDDVDEHNLEMSYKLEEEEASKMK
jgi:MFS family permease